MISLIEALNYRCLRYISQPLESFHALVGPNASGKTTFMDVISFLGEVVSNGPDTAVRERTDNLQDLVWGRIEEGFELAIEAEIPKTIKNVLGNSWKFVRYEISIGLDPETKKIGIRAEKVLLKPNIRKDSIQRKLFPNPLQPPLTLLSRRPQQGVRTVVNKVPQGNDNFYSEVHRKAGKGWAPTFKLGSQRSALGNLPADESKFPVSTWLKELLTDGVQQVVLNSLLMRKASPPGKGLKFQPDGSNLPWVIETLREKSEERFAAWINHLNTALPELESVRTVERSDDKHRYLLIRYAGSLEVPAWVVSDGTLRLMALTLPAYLSDFLGVYLIEEPENGVHPQAVETMLQSLSSVYDAQILLATHSPVILSVIEPDKVLCFAKSDEGATDIVRGSEHPKLKSWRGEENLGVLFAAGVLG